jgi:carbamoyltransferase
MINLGISYTGIHDSSCCIIIDGRLVFAISEERLTRKKHDSSFPVYAIKSALDYCNIKPNEIDNVVLDWSHPLRQFLFDVKLNFKTNQGFKSLMYTMYSRLHSVWIKGGLKRYKQHFGDSNFIFCPHHLSHALSAYAYSDMDEATVLVIDGRGAYESTSIWYADKGQIKPVEIIEFPNSLGFFYAKFTKYLGFQPMSDEWKVMGLAPYGKDGVDLSKFIDTKNFYEVHWKNLFGKGLTDISGIESYLGKLENGNPYGNQECKDIAFAVQRETEKAFLNIIESAVKKTGCKNLCLAGGVALNCKANGLVAQSGIVDDLFVQPVASDEGACLGAALYPYLKYHSKVPKIELSNLYLGQDYEDKYIEDQLTKYKLNYKKVEKPEKEVAKLLADGNIIGLFNGRTEFGPRALGNRSIIADPRNPDMKNKVNDSVKYRENWRPFAPSILEEYYDDYFNTNYLSPFMILSFPVRDDVVNKIPAAVHVDGTSRPQTVSKKTNLFYWNIINEFKTITGIPVILNTSFNLKDEPIVDTPYDAIRTFYTSGLDCLVLGEFIVSKIYD